MIRVIYDHTIPDGKIPMIVAMLENVHGEKIEIIGVSDVAFEYGEVEWDETVDLAIFESYEDTSTQDRFLFIHKAKDTDHAIKLKDYIDEIAKLKFLNAL